MQVRLRRPLHPGSSYTPARDTGPDAAAVATGQGDVPLPSTTFYARCHPAQHASFRSVGQMPRPQLLRLVSSRGYGHSRPARRTGWAGRGCCRQNSAQWRPWRLGCRVGATLPSAGRRACGGATRCCEGALHLMWNGRESPQRQPSARARLSWAVRRLRQAIFGALTTRP
jgi:hypothetical protein